MFKFARPSVCLPLAAVLFQACYGQSANQSFSAQISVDANTTVRASVPDTLYGVNLEWIHNLWGSWNNSTNSLAPKADALAKTLSPTVLRFPGGTFSDFYHWRNGVGNPYTRPPAPITSGDQSWNGFGTDEALTLASRVGARLMITVNVGTGTAQEAADWVRYVNTGGTRVRDWELGNELYAKTLSADAAKVTIPPDVYAQRVRDFARAMRAVDPNIRIGAIGGEGVGPLPLVEYPDWNRIVLEQAGSDIDFLTVHNAYAPVMVIDRNESLETVYKAMLAAPAQIRASMKRIEADIAQYAPVSARSHIKIAVSEWGPLFHVSPLSRFIDHGKTLASALYTASTLMTFIEDPQVEGAQFFKLIDNSYAGLLGIRNGEWQEIAPFYALQLFRKNFGTRLIGTSVATPFFHSDASGILPAMDGNPNLQAVSSLNADGTALYVIVVNRNLTDDADVQMTLSGLKAGSQATVRTLQGTGIDANTGTQLPFPDQIPWARQAKASVNPQFDSGAPGQVGIQTKMLPGVGPSFQYRFPAASVTAFEIPVLR